MTWQGVLGIVFLLGLAWAMSERRNAVPWRLVVSGVVLQFALALILLRFDPVENALEALNDVVLAVQAATQQGTAFVFGYIGGGPAPFEPSNSGNLFILAFQGLPLILVVSALSALLFYWRVLPAIVRGFAWLLRKSLGVSGAAGFSTAANVFVGMVEAPLLIRPYLRDMDRAGLFLVMTAGMATIAGNMFVLYATILSSVIPDAAGNLMTASVISAPAAIAIAALMLPFDAKSQKQELSISSDAVSSSAEAVVNGTLEGMKLVISVAATLIVAVALVALVNQVLGILPEIGGASLSLQRALGWILAPVAWLMGIPWSDAPLAGQLMGTKIVLNELVAYLEMAALPPDTLTPHGRLVLTYALCGFANLGSLGILLGGLAAMVPERRAEIVGLGPKSLLAGTISCFMTGAVVGLVA
jgi:CNT family concentrative nucleoside transporter